MFSRPLNIKGHLRVRHGSPSVYLNNQQRDRLDWSHDLFHRYNLPGTDPHRHDLHCEVCGDWAVILNDYVSLCLKDAAGPRLERVMRQVQKAG